MYPRQPMFWISQLITLDNTSGSVQLSVPARTLRQVTRAITRRVISEQTLCSAATEMTF